MSSTTVATGGGGGGAGGGDGGGGGGGNAGGLGGTNAHKDGYAGTSGSNGSGGGGGGGGYNRLVGSGADLAAAGSTFAGGAGGAGGAGSRDANLSSFGGPGGGGAGGYGAIISGTNIQNAATVKGGAGGAGGGGGGTGFSSGGGDGGVGLLTTAAATTITNSGSIVGGSGGAGGNGGGSGNGAAGVIGSGLTIVNSGTIAGGMDGSGKVQADAITFTSGANILALGGPNPMLTGALDIQSGTLTFDQSVAANLPTYVPVSNAIIGGGAVVKAASGTLYLSGANTYSGGTTIAAGTLAVDSDGNLGATTGGLTFAGGTLETTGTFASARAVTLNTAGTTQVDSGTTTLSGVIGGNGGMLTKTGSGALILSNANTYTGGTTISAGTLQLGDGTTNGSVVGAITDNSVLALDPNGSQTFANTISGSGALSKIGTGTAVLSGANTFSGGTSVSAGTLSIASDGNLGDASGGVTLAGGTLETTANITSARGITVSGAGTVQVDSGVSTTLSGNIGNGASAGYFFKSGAGTLTLSGVNSYTGGTEIDAGTLAVGADGALGASSGGLTFGGGTLETTATFASGRNITLGQAGRIQVDAGVTTTLSGRISGGAALVKSGGGTLTLSGAANMYFGGTTITGGILDLAARVTTTQGPAGTGAISFQAATGSTATLALDSAAQPASSATFGTTLDSFGAADSLNLKGFAFNSMSTKVTYDSSGHLLTITNGTKTESFKLTNETPGFGSMYYASDDGNGGTVINNTVCFASGTLIRTLRGEVAVEALAVGDMVVTSSGARRPIIWLGHRTVECRGAERRHNRPVRIAAEAFGANQPCRDLYLSPQHAVAVNCLDEVLIPVKHLINGGTIAQVEVESVTYWHVELDQHDVILAENLACESFLDTQGRVGFFDNGAEHAAAHPGLALKSMEDFCRPLVQDGPIVAATRAQLQRRMQSLGWHLTHEADLHLVADGVRIDPVMADEAARFLVPSGTRELLLCSKRFVPNEVDAASGDGRRLGVPLKGLTLSDGFATRGIDIEDAMLADGFSFVQRDAELAWRWTDGDAVLPPELWADCHGSFFLRVDLASERGRYKAWQKLSVLAGAVNAPAATTITRLDAYRDKVA